jgi:hypothetical protein
VAKNSKQVVWKCVTAQVLGTTAANQNVIQEEIKKGLGALSPPAA